MENWKLGLKKVFSHRTFVLLFLALLLILLPAYTILTGIFLPGTLLIDPALNATNAFLSLAAAVIGAAGLTVTAYQEFELHRLTIISKLYIASGLAGLLVSVILMYKSAWLVSVGLGIVALLLADYSIYIVIGSILFTLYTIGAALEDAATSRKKK